MGMFCFQCQEAAGGKGCTVQGVCGKQPQTAGLMDVLLYAVRGTALVNRALREKGAADKAASRQLLDALFCTITNANFDDDAILLRIAQVLATKNELIGTAKKHGVELPEFSEVSFHPAPAEYEAFAAHVGVLSMHDEDIRSLKQLVIYGAKGAAAYTEHALNLGFEDEDIYEMLEKDRGKVIYFDFWVKWCPPCLTEMEPLKQLRSKYSTKDLVIYSICGSEPKEEWEECLDKYSLRNRGIECIYANDFFGKENYQKICNQWNVHDMPYYILINRKGQIIDFGSSARPSNPNLRSRIEEAVKNIK